MQVLETDAHVVNSPRSSIGMLPSQEHTVIELAGTDRPGLLSEVSAVLTDLGCNVVNAEIWTHNARAAAVMHITEQSTGCAVEEPKRLSLIKELLCMYSYLTSRWPDCIISGFCFIQTIGNCLAVLA